MVIHYKRRPTGDQDWLLFLVLLLLIEDEGGNRAIVAPLPTRREETAGDFAVATVVGDAFAAVSLARTGFVCTGTAFHAGFVFAGHGCLLCFGWIEHHFTKTISRLSMCRLLKRQ